MSKHLPTNYTFVKDISGACLGKEDFMRKEKRRKRLKLKSKLKSEDKPDNRRNADDTFHHSF